MKPRMFQMNKKPQPNWKVIIIETGEIVEKYRLKLTADQDIVRLKRIYPYKLEVQRIW